MAKDDAVLDALPDRRVRELLARLHREAGLLEYVEIREGDATETLRELDTPVDMLLCDGFPPAMLPVLQLVAPRIRPGGVVVSDNVGAFWADHTDFLAWVRDPANGFQSAMLAMNEGTELSVKVAAMEALACAS